MGYVAGARCAGARGASGHCETLSQVPRPSPFCFRWFALLVKQLTRPYTRDVDIARTAAKRRGGARFSFDGTDLANRFRLSLYSRVSRDSIHTYNFTSSSLISKRRELSAPRYRRHLPVYLVAAQQKHRQHIGYIYTQELITRIVSSSLVAACPHSVTAPARR